MSTEIPEAGGIPADLAELVSVTWAEEARAARVDLSGFNPAASLEQRLAWAVGLGLCIAAVLARFSTKLQQSTADQVRACAVFAARNGFYLPPEYVCADEGVSGRKQRRDGLERVTRILKTKLATVLLVYKLSRLCRTSYGGYKFFQEELVEEGLRGVSVSQQIDTADTKTWEQLTVLHGLSDKMLLEAIADHVRTGLEGLFREGYVTGALPVGYRRREVPGGRPTKRDRPRTVPEIDPETAQLIRTHYEWIRDGMSVTEGLRRWVKAGGPCDPRSTTRRMTYPAYRRLLSNPRYLGRFAFGRKRNQWSSKRDYTRQIPQPETEVTIVHSEELRIVSDELFHAVQEKLEKLKSGPRGPKAGTTAKPVRLWDLVTDCFVCGPCTAERGGDRGPAKPVRFYVAGAHAKGMRCKHGALCPTPIIIDREAAVGAICRALGSRISEDAALVAEIVGLALERDAAGDESVQEDLEQVERQIAGLGRKIDDLLELAGEGSDEDRAALRAKVRGAQAERASLQSQAATLRRALTGPVEPVTPARVHELLADFATLLADAAAGLLGQDVVYKAGETFRRLVGERIVVTAVPRPGRTRPDVKCVLTLSLVEVIRHELGMPRAPGSAGCGSSEIEVWLRRSRKDALAAQAADFVDAQGLSYEEASAAFAAVGEKVMPPAVWQLRKRHYEITGQAVPKRPYNNGRPRQSMTDEAL